MPRTLPHHSAPFTISLVSALWGTAFSAVVYSGTDNIVLVRGAHNLIDQVFFVQQVGGFSGERLGGTLDE